MHLYVCVNNIMNTKMVCITYLKTENMLMVYVIRGKHALEISPKCTVFVTV